MQNGEDPGNGPLIGTQGVSKVLVEALIDGTAVILSVALPAGAPLIAAGATALKGVGPLLQEHQDRNIDMMLAAGGTDAGMTTEELLAAVTADPERLLPFVIACDAARRTALDDKVKALGRAVAQLANDDALVDESAIWIDIFSKVDRAHVRMVKALCQMDPEHDGYGRLWKRHELRQECGLSSTVSVLISTLVSLGLMREVRYEELSQHDKARWGVSAPGANYSPVYGKGPLTSDFMQRLETASKA